MDDDEDDEIAALVEGVEIATTMPYDDALAD